MHTPTTPPSNQDPIQTVQEPDGRWLAWVESPRIASYGTTEEDALSRTWEAMRDSDIVNQLTCEHSFAMPNMDEEEELGENLVSLISRWTGIPKAEFERSAL